MYYHICVCHVSYLNTNLLKISSQAREGVAVGSCVFMLLCYGVGYLSFVFVKRDGFAVGRRTVVMGGNKEDCGSHSSTRNYSVYKSV